MPRLSYLFLAAFALFSLIVSPNPAYAKKGKNKHHYAQKNQNKN